LALALLFLAIAAPGAQAQTYTVTNLSDSGVSGDGSLRGEVLAANSHSGADTVEFAGPEVGQDAARDAKLNLTYGRLVLSDPERYSPERLLDHARWLVEHLVN
jgi:hypothetical protein